MILERERSYTPVEILSHPYSNEDDHLDRLDKQKLTEAKIAAVFARAIGTIQNGIEDIRIELGDRRDILPDVKVTFTEEDEKDKTGKRKKELDIEVVKFNKYSEREGIKNFLERTKLSPVYAYPEQTLILCSVDMNIKNPEKMAERIHNVLHRRNCPHRIVMIFENEEEPLVAEVYPEFEVFREKE